MAVRDTDRSLAESIAARLLMPDTWLSQAESAIADCKYGQMVTDTSAATAHVGELLIGPVVAGAITLRDKLFFVLPNAGHRLRSHDGELYYYNSAGVWGREKSTLLRHETALRACVCTLTRPQRLGP